MREFKFNFLYFLGEKEDIAGKYTRNGENYFIRQQQYQSFPLPWFGLVGLVSGTRELVLGHKDSEIVSLVVNSYFIWLAVVLLGHRRWGGGGVSSGRSRPCLLWSSFW